jgi:hypothetical protein
LEVALAAEVSSVGFKALAQLQHLRHFLFDDGKESYCSWELVRKCLLLCARHLPKLKVMGSAFSDINWHHMNVMTDFENCFYHDQVVQQPATLSLEQLVLSGEVNLHKDFQVPELRQLHWFGPRNTIVGLFHDRFSSVSEIEFCDPAVNVVMPVLQAVGWRLRSLTIEQSSEEEITHEALPLFSLFQLCPRLERLTLTECKFVAFNVKWREEIFGCLQEITIQPVYEEPLPHGFVSKVCIF